MHYTQAYNNKLLYLPKNINASIIMNFKIFVTIYLDMSIDRYNLYFLLMINYIYKNFRKKKRSYN